MPKIFGKHVFHGLFHKDHDHPHSNMEAVGKKPEPPVHHKEKPFPKLILEDVSRKTTQKSIFQVLLQDMRVLIRVDFNVPMKEMRVANNYKIKQAIPTIEYCFKHGAKCVILMSHLGRPGGRVEKTYSLKPVAEELENLLGKPITFLDDCIGEKVEEACADPKEGSVILLENLRFHPEEKGKGQNDKFEEIQCTEAQIAEFRMALSRLGDVYVNDAFGVCHRNHSSVVGITKVQKACGLLLKKEMDNFHEILHEPPKPVIAVIGGAKVADKIDAINNLLDLANDVIIMGATAYTFLKEVEGTKIGKSLYVEGQKDTIKEIMQRAQEKHVKIHLPEDFVIAEKNEKDAEDRQCSAKEGIPENQMGLDIGFESCKKFAHIIKEAKTIIWDGPAGVYEYEKFMWGTRSILQAVMKAGNCGASVVIGGGETVAAVLRYANELGCIDDIPNLSTGGGACLHLLQGRKLPGFEALSAHDVNEPKKKTTQPDNVLEETDPKSGKPKEKKPEDSVNTQQTVM